MYPPINVDSLYNFQRRNVKEYVENYGECNWGEEYRDTE